MHGALRILSARVLTRRAAFVDLKWSPCHVKMMRITFGGIMNENNSSNASINTASNITNNNGPSNRHHFGTISGGGLSEDRRITFGYSSFQGKRATMEDFYDAKISKVDDQMVGLFGVFDGHGGSRAAEYLKHHLFDNLIKHPQFATDTKLALTETYQQTDSEFLKEESSMYRDDGSTASTAVLVGDRLYVANVGDSRAVIMKAGEGFAEADVFLEVKEGPKQWIMKGDLNIINKEMLAIDHQLEKFRHICLKEFACHPCLVEAGGHWPILSLVARTHDFGLALQVRVDSSLNEMLTAG